MNILLWVIFGAIAGWIASLIMKTDENQGFLADIILGIAGAIVGGFVFGLIGQPGVSGFNIYSLLVAVLGSVAVIWLGRMLYRTR